MVQNQKCFKYSLFMKPTKFTYVCDLRRNMTKMNINVCNLFFFGYIYVQQFFITLFFAILHTDINENN